MADPYEAMTGPSFTQQHMMFMQDSAEEDFIIEASKTNPSYIQKSCLPANTNKQSIWNYEEQLESFIKQSRKKIPKKQ